MYIHLRPALVMATDFTSSGACVFSLPTADRVRFPQLDKWNDRTYVVHSMGLGKQSNSARLRIAKDLEMMALNMLKR